MSGEVTFVRNGTFLRHLSHVEQAVRNNLPLDEDCQRIMQICLVSLHERCDEVKRKCAEINAILSKKENPLSWLYKLLEAACQSEPEEFLKQVEDHLEFASWVNILPPAPQSPKKKIESKALPVEVLPEAVQSDKKEVTDVRAGQEKLLSLCGWRVFKDYLQPMLPDCVNYVTHLLKQPDIAKQLGSLLAKSVLPPAPPANATPSPTKSTKLLQYTLMDQMRGLIKTLERTVKDDELRHEFADRLLEMLCAPPKEPFSKTQKEIAHCIIKLYVPDLLHAALKACIPQSDSEGLPPWIEKVILTLLPGDTHAQMIQLCCYMIEHQMSLPLEKATEALLTRLQDDTISEQVLSKIRDSLIQSFYSEPGDFPVKLRHILVKVLSNIQLFLHSIHAAIHQQAKEKTAASAEPDVDIVQKMVFKLLETKSVDFDSGAERTLEGMLSHGLKNQFESLMWRSLYPQIAPPYETATPLQKLVVLFLSLLGTALVKSILTPHNLNLLIARLLDQPLGFENPFEGPPPAVKSVEDVAFSAKLDESIKDIVKQLGMLGDNRVLSALVNGILYLVPTGSKIQLALNTLTNSEVTLLPVLVIIQFLYKIQWLDPIDVKKMPPVEQKQIQDQHLRAQFYQALAQPAAAFQAKTLVSPSNEEKKALKDAMQCTVLMQPDRLQKILEEKLPFGTRNAALNIIQSLYRLGSQDLFLKILAAYILDGVKKGITLSSSH